MANSRHVFTEVYLCTRPKNDAWIESKRNRSLLRTTSKRILCTLAVGVDFLKSYQDLALYHIGTSALITARSLDIFDFSCEKNFESSKDRFWALQSRGSPLDFAPDHGARARSPVLVVEKITNTRCRRRWLDTRETKASQSFARGERGGCKRTCADSGTRHSANRGREGRR